MTKYRNQPIFLHEILFKNIVSKFAAIVSMGTELESVSHDVCARFLLIYVLRWVRHPLFAFSCDECTHVQKGFGFYIARGSWAMFTKVIIQSIDKNIFSRERAYILFYVYLRVFVDR